MPLPINLQAPSSKHPMRGSRRRILLVGFCLVLSLAELGATCPRGLQGVRLLQGSFRVGCSREVGFRVESFWFRVQDSGFWKERLGSLLGFPVGALGSRQNVVTPERIPVSTTWVASPPMSPVNQCCTDPSFASYSLRQHPREGAQSTAKAAPPIGSPKIGTCQCLIQTTKVPSSER